MTGSNLLDGIFYGCVVIWLALVAVWLWWTVYRRSRAELHVGGYVRVLEPGIARYTAMIRRTWSTAAGDQMALVEPIRINRKRVATVVGAPVTVSAKYVRAL